MPRGGGRIFRGSDPSRHRIPGHVEAGRLKLQRSSPRKRLASLSRIIAGLEEKERIGNIAEDEQRILSDARNRAEAIQRSLKK